MMSNSIQMWWHNIHVGNVVPNGIHEFEYFGDFDLTTTDSMLVSFLRADTQECEDEVSRYCAFDAAYLESLLNGWSLRYPDGTLVKILQPAIYVDDKEAYWEVA